MAKVRFHKGLKANLPSTGLVSGHYYQCTDTGEIFLATSATNLLLVGHGNKVFRTVAEQDAIDTAIESRLDTIENKEAGWNEKYNKPSSGIPETDFASGVRAKLNQVIFGHLDNGQFIKEGESTPVIPAVKTLYVDTISHSEYVWNATDGFVPMGGGGSDLPLSVIEGKLCITFNE